jgi:hypothetical protein
MEKVLTSGLREKMKAIIQAELETLAETLETLEPEKRLNIVCKLLPFVCPKVDSISHQDGEPISW